MYFKLQAFKQFLIHIIHSEEIINGSSENWSISERSDL